MNIHIDRLKIISQFRRHRMHVHCAIILRGKKILATAFNKIASRPESPSLHAERSVIKSLGDTDLLKGSILVVVRLGKTPDIYKNSKPCEACASFLHTCMKKYGLKQVYYSF